MARNLSRNTELYISTLAPADLASVDGSNTGVALGDNNTWKVNVLDGYSFSQDTSTQEIGVSEAASECTGIAGLARATLTFNTALNPVDVSFGVYVRPYDTTGTLGGDGPSCVELPIWAAALGKEINLTNSPDTVANAAVFDVSTGTTDTLTFTTELSDVNELMVLHLYFVLDSTTYVVGEFSVGTIEADFSIDGIAMLNISGSGTTIKENPLDVHTTIAAWTGDTDYVDVPTTSSQSFLRNKLGTLELTDNQGVAGTGDSEAATSAVTGQDIAGFTGLGTADAYVGGRVYSAAAGSWATIVSHNDTTITVASYEDISAASWDGTAVDAFLPSSHAAVSYCIPITGGSLTLENNMSYLTPEELAEIGTVIETHIKMERDAVQFGTAAKASSSNFVHKYFLNYLLEDERKHDEMLDQLNNIKQKIYPYA